MVVAGGSLVDLWGARVRGVRGGARALWFGSDLGCVVAIKCKDFIKGGRGVGDGYGPDSWKQFKSVPNRACVWALLDRSHVLQARSSKSRVLILSLLFFPYNWKYARCITIDDASMVCFMSSWTYHSWAQPD
jgi:hypothetical protein